MAVYGFSTASIQPCGKPQLIPSARLPSQILFSLLRIMAATFCLYSFIFILFLVLGLLNSIDVKFVLLLIF